MTTDARFTRQARLVEVGESGQARLAGASSTWLATEQRRTSRRDTCGAQAFEWCSPGAARVTISDPEPPWMDGLTPAAREVASGAYGALIAIRAVLSGAAHPRVEDEP